MWKTKEIILLRGRFRTFPVHLFPDVSRLLPWRPHAWARTEWSAANQSSNSNTANNSRFSEPTPILGCFLLCTTHMSTPTVSPCGKLLCCVVRVPQLEFPPSQLVTDIYCCFSRLLSSVINMHLMLVGFQFCCKFFHLGNKTKALVAARNAAIKEKPCSSSIGSVKLEHIVLWTNVHSGSTHLNCHDIIAGVFFSVSTENLVESTLT